MLLSGKYQIDDCRTLEKLRNSPKKECTIIGIPYLDEKEKRLTSCLKTNIAKETTTILVAPSWGTNSLLNRFGNKLIDQLIATGYHIIIRPHPQSFTSEKDLIDRLIKEYPRLEWNRDTDNFEVLNRSDIMISDFSGVIFDFALVFDKPVICAYTDFDDSQYDAWWLDTPIWTATAVPRIGPILSEETVSEIKHLIEQCLIDDSYSDSRKKVRDETWENRGKGACTAANYLMKKYASLIEESENKEQILIDIEGDAAENLGRKTNIEGDANVVSDGDKILHEDLPDIVDNPNSNHKKGTRKIPILIGIGTLLIVSTFCVQSYLKYVTEKSFWLDIKSMTLMPSAYDMPAPYGVGTSRAGGATKDYIDEEGNPLWDYDESRDYSNMIIKVTVDPDSEGVLVEWVVSDVNNYEEGETTTEAEISG